MNEETRAVTQAEQEKLRSELEEANRPTRQQERAAARQLKKRRRGKGPMVDSVQMRTGKRSPNRRERRRARASK